MISHAQLSREIRQEAGRLGFVRVGFSPTGESDSAGRLRDWLWRDFHGTMKWMERDPAQRSDPRNLFPETRTVISVAMSYDSEAPGAAGEPLVGRISRYAWGEDYHRILRERLDLLLGFIRERSGKARGKVCVDTSPVLEKAWAGRGGVGWQGKHSNTIVQDAGCWIFLGEILLNLPLEYDAPAPDRCGTCTRCIDVCPSGAIVEPYVLDSRLCVSYLNIELRGPIPEALRPHLGDRIFGCDDCLEVCPWNRFRKGTAISGFRPFPENRRPDLEGLAGMTREEFLERFRGSPVKRALYEGFLRNVAVALGNSGSQQALPALRVLLAHESPLVRSHAAWALGRIGGVRGRGALLEARNRETDPSVSEEIGKALRKTCYLGGFRL